MQKFLDLIKKVIYSNDRIKECVMRKITNVGAHTFSEIQSPKHTRKGAVPPAFEEVKNLQRATPASLSGRVTVGSVRRSRGVKLRLPVVPPARTR